MTEDAGMKLLAAIEALSAEVRGMRDAMHGERESRENLQRMRDQKAASQKKWRANLKARVSRESTVETPEVLPAHVVVVLDPKQRDQDQELPAPVEPPKNLPPPTLPVWRAYAAAYRARYRVDPVRNAKVNGQLLQLIRRLGVEEAPLVAAFYLTHNAAKYIGKCHDVGMLLLDCEGLRTQWAAGRKVTSTAARQIDQTQANLDSWGELMSEEGRNALVGK